jgi:transposase
MSGSFDARRLPPRVQEDLRRQVVAAVEAGMSQQNAAETFGVSRRAVGTWVRAARTVGPEALAARRRGRAPGEQLALDADAQATVLEIIVAGSPEHCGLAAPLWNRRVVADLIERHTGRRVSVPTVGQYLVRWGIADVPRPPARRTGTVATLLPGRTRRTACETLWMNWTQVRGGLHALLAQAAGGALSFLAAREPFDLAALVDFGERLARAGCGPVHLLVHGWPREHAPVLRAWTTDPGPRVRLTLT